MDQSLIKVEMNSSDDSLQLNLVPLVSTTAAGIQKEIAQRQEEIQQEGAFYLSTVMPSIKNNRQVQQNLIQALFNILEVKMRESYLEEDIKIYKRIYGKYNDSDLSKVRGLLTVVFSSLSKKPLRLDISIREHSGQAIITSYRIHSPFEEYIVRNQKPLDLTSDAGRELLGFSLGDKIYLRNKDSGKGEAEAVYLPYDFRMFRPINTLGIWNEDLEMSVLYEDGGERNLSWQRSEFFGAGGIGFSIQPLFQEQKIDGKLYDIYEINGLVADGETFFEPISSLCLIEGFNVLPGIFDHLFESELMRQITQAKQQTEIQAIEQAEAHIENQQVIEAQTKNQTEEQEETQTEEQQTTELQTESQTEEQTETQTETQTEEQQVTESQIENQISNQTGEQQTTIEAQTTTPHLLQEYESCPYIVPQDKKFAGLKSVYFFPLHRLSLAFKNRELSSVKIYKRPVENPSTANQEQ